MSRDELVGICIMGFVLLVFFLCLASSASDCSNEGGQLVRGVFWFECVRGVG